MTEIIIITLTFVAGFLAVFAANLMLLDLMQSDQKRLQERMGARISEEQMERQRERARESHDQFKDLGDLAAEALDEAATGSRSLADRFKSLVEQAGIKQTPTQLMTFVAVSAAVPGAVGLVLLGNLLISCGLAVVGGTIPLLVVQFKRYRRIETLRSQLPDAFELMSRILRAGQSMPQAMQAVAQEFKAPVALEFAYCYEQQNLGLAPEFALRDLARRTGLLEVKIFVLAMLVHRQTGGNLTEILDKLSTIVRDRFRIRGVIASLTAEGRVQAAILLALPLVMFSVLMIINRGYAVRLFEHPILPVIALSLMAIGALCIRKIVNFDF
ncbi:MAG: type II secretion system F family protein [Planctomycetaceae bacterium]